MVESIGSSPLNGSGNVSRVTAPSAVPSPQAVAAQPSPTQANPAVLAASAGAQLSGLAKALASEAPIDSDRVQEIRKAIQNGSFPILPATIADRLIALKLNWDGNEKA
ncbi:MULTISPECIES: flagellar biosynthesis anti-sigma factor FlgM [Sphingomonas]|jgi:negative regulator of flagellin synthesis FlgM|uniref:flagellar biosynthesis anti-sigma factor FlgM n=1 Tax=Sphingomonas TaxID=13687 RepID=UPI001AEF21C9|nr:MULTISPECIES: flagellar biosynthesis anti-sigma factor FlgM [Sphingomonas]